MIIAAGICRLPGMLMVSEKIQSERLPQDVALSLILPTSIEGEDIAGLIDRIESSLEPLPFDLIVVDDASPDGTAECAKDLNERYGNIRVIRREGKLGLSSAILAVARLSRGRTSGFPNWRAYVDGQETFLSER